MSCLIDTAEWFIYVCLYVAELEKKLSELQKYVKNEGEQPLPTWLQEEMERAGLSTLPRVCNYWTLYFVVW